MVASVGKAFDIQQLRTLGELAERIADIEHRGTDPVAEPAPPVATGWPMVDQALGGLKRGAVHEWFSTQRAGSCPTPASPPSADAPLCLLSHLARRAIDDGGYAVWVGRACWPYPHTLVRGGGADRLLLTRSVFIDPPHDAARLWAVDMALRCAGVAVVVADGAGLELAATRRLQLAARAGQTLGLLARPPNDRAEPTAAATRWAVQAVASPTTQPRWAIELIKCKGAACPGADHAQAAALMPETNDKAFTGRSLPGAVVLEWNGAKGVIAIPADLVDRPDSTARKIA